MLSALNKSPISETMCYQELDLLRMNRHIKTMVVHIKAVYRFSKSHYQMYKMI